MKFIITVDTEADDQWRAGNNVTINNVKYLPRFQELCDRYNFPVTYLVTYEIATSKEAVDVLKPWQDKGKAEIGAHLHPWSTPPYPEDQSKYLFISELPDRELELQLENITAKIEKNFRKPPVSFRGGRWSFDKRVGKKLISLGYRVDCSVTPKINWQKIITKGNKNYAPDYSWFSAHAHYLEDESLLEVPMTILYTNFLLIESSPLSLIGENLPFGMKKIWQKFSGLKWLRIFPQTTVADLIKVYKSAVRNKLGFIEFMIHSSELIPGASPYSKTNNDVERIYSILEEFFQFLKLKEIVGLTLGDFTEVFKYKNNE